MEKMAQADLLKDSSGNKDLGLLTHDVTFKASSVLCDRKNSNQIIELLEKLMSENPEEVIMAVDCLQRIFTGFLSSGDISEFNVSSIAQIAGDDPEKKFKIWLLEQYNETKEQFLSLLNHPKKVIQKASAEGMLTLLVAENEKFGGKSGFLKELIATLLTSEKDMRQAIGVLTVPDLEESMKPQILGQVYASLKQKQKEEVNDIYLQNVYAFLRVNWITKKLMDNGNINMNKMKTLYTESWVQFLKYEVPFQLYKRILVDLHDKVLPNMKNPLIFTDFLTESYNYGGAVSLLALNGLFFLMQKCNLEYPNFFEKLYSLLSEDLFTGKYCPQLFFLMDIFLSSIHVPAYLVAAFVKKLSRLSLSAPPHVLLIIIPFVKNLLVRHPSLRVMINRTDVTEIASDPYLPEETCLNKCRALESSLWEIMTLQHHWHPSVSKQACFINKSLPSMETDMADFLDINYSQLFEEEMETELKKVPLSYDVPKGLFDRSEDRMSSFWGS